MGNSPPRRSFPSEDHEHFVEVLVDFASLLGFYIPIRQLPNGSRPDVCLWCPPNHGIFLGDAKASEAPTCLQTQLRYDNYIRWLMHSGVNISASMCAICFSDITQAPEWQDLLLKLLRRYALKPSKITTRQLGYPTGIVCTAFKHTAR
jgi:hypothetical protein